MSVDQYGNDTETPCECCGAPGMVAQAPWPLPMTTCHCNDCTALERIAFSVWRELNPTAHKFNAPVPFMKSKADYPPETLAGHEPGKKEALREWWKQKLSSQFIVVDYVGKVDAKPREPLPPEELEKAKRFAEHLEKSREVKFKGLQ